MFVLQLPDLRVSGDVPLGGDLPREVTGTSVCKVSSDFLRQVTESQNSSNKTDKKELSSRASLPCGDLSVVIFRWSFEDVDGHSVTRIVSEAEHIWVHQGVLNK